MGYPQNLDSKGVMGAGGRGSGGFVLKIEPYNYCAPKGLNYRQIGGKKMQGRVSGKGNGGLRVEVSQVPRCEGPGAPFESTGCAEKASLSG